MTILSLRGTVSAVAIQVVVIPYLIRDLVVCHSVLDTESIEISPKDTEIANF